MELPRPAQYPTFVLHGSQGHVPERIRHLPEGRTHMEQPGLRDEEADESIARFVVLAVLATVVAGGGLDLYLDAPRALTPHVAVELTLVTVSASTAIYLWRGWRRATAALGTARNSIAAHEAQRDEWRRQAEASLKGLRAAIDDQFSRWQLTPAEREVALLLLQGLGHKQAAARTGRSERTVRQHAVAIYHKSGLQGRAELAAWFLEGLVPPIAVAAVPGARRDQGHGAVEGAP